MNWRHVQLIFQREMRDQLRDRRTLFTITVLPLLLYPLLGLLMMQVAQFKREQTVRIRIIGAENWPADLALVTSDTSSSGVKEYRLASSLGEPGSQELIELEVDAWPTSGSVEQIVRNARQSLSANTCDAILLIEPGFQQTLTEKRALVHGIHNGTRDGQKNVLEESRSPESEKPEPEKLEPATSESKTLESASPESEKPIELTQRVETDLNSAQNSDAPLTEVVPNGLQIVANMARDRSQVAVRRLHTTLRQWQQDWIGRQLADVGLNPGIVEPLDVVQNDTSESSVRRAMLWAKILPFIMLVWALTGAFYPAIDLCAGEKERGTLETLLSSPARRREIVWGKLFTVATFSMLSALLNLLSMHLTTGFIIEQLTSQGTTQFAEAMGRLPLHAFGWLVLLLLPMSAFFSALALAVAALARSTKEGQYYLMPLLLFTLPLVTLPMIPSLDLTLATSMVPVSGAIFLVRALIENRYAEAFIHLPVVFGVTAICCLLSIRWAVRQFESEAVMFSESERWNFQSWLRQVWRDRGIVASPSEAMLCGLIILVAMFFSQFIAAPTSLQWDTLAQRAVVTQLGLILSPCLLMAIFLTRSLRQALRLHKVPLDQVAAAILLAVTLHPSYTLLGHAIASTIEIGPETQRVLQTVSELISAQPLWAVLLILAVVPAICEELAYRGFIFGGLLRNGGAMRAVLLSSLFFGLAHSFLQQSIAATIMGVLLGVVAWRTGSVVCTMLIHVINNTLSVSLGWMTDRELELPAALDWFVALDKGQWHYQPTWITISIALSAALLFVLWRRTPTAQRLAEAEMA